MSQQLQALELACDVKAAQARLCRQLREPQGRTVLADRLDEPDATLGSLRVWRALTACHRVGPNVASSLLSSAGLSPFRTGERRVRDLTVRERSALAEVLR